MEGGAKWAVPGVEASRRPAWNDRAAVGPAAHTIPVPFPNHVKEDSCLVLINETSISINLFSIYYTMKSTCQARLGAVPGAWATPVNTTNPALRC